MSGREGVARFINQSHLVKIYSGYQLFAANAHRHDGPSCDLNASALFHETWRDHAGAGTVVRGLFVSFNDC